MKTRIIAKLDVKPPYVIKPVHFEGLRKIGLSVDLAKKYYKQGADEVIYIDVVASLYQREILFGEIKMRYRIKYQITKESKFKLDNYLTSV